MRPAIGLVTTLAICALAAAAPAQEKMNPAVAARQAQMTLHLFQAGYLGAMAQGKIEYDAEGAQAAADSLVGLGEGDWSRYWAPGTDAGSVEGTLALPALFENLDDVAAKQEDLLLAEMNLQAVAGEGKDQMAQALGAVFGACTACHKLYRQAQ